MNRRKVAKAALLAIGLIATEVAGAATTSSASSSSYDMRSSGSISHSSSSSSHSSSFSHPTAPRTSAPNRPNNTPARPNTPAASSGRTPANMPRVPAANLQHQGVTPRGPYPAAPGSSRPVPGAAYHSPASTAESHAISEASIRYFESQNRGSFANSGEAHMANGGVTRTRADGSRAEIHDVQRGVDIHYGSNGSRRIMTERADHSRVFAEHGSGYVQHPYLYRGQEMAHRTYWDHGHEFAHFYSPTVYHGVPLQVYAPTRFYSAGYYGWMYSRWPASIHYTWGWAGRPWYVSYRHYFAVYPVYDDATYWLTDYLIATSLEAAYAAQIRAQMAEGDSAVMSREVKGEIEAEVKAELQQEAAAARANAADPQGLPDNGGISNTLTDGYSHVFLAGSSLDATSGSGDECTISAGDVVQVRAAPAPGATSVNATVLASKGGSECATGSMVRVGVSDLQEMQNYMHQIVDQGVEDLQAHQGTGNLPAPPATAQGAAVSAGFAVGAPPPDADAQAQINAQVAIADQAEKAAVVANAQ